MGVVTAVVATVFLAMSVLLSSVNIKSSQQKVELESVERIELVNAAKSGLRIAKEALQNDPIWNDCKGADRNCQSTDENGFFVLYSDALQKDINNYEVKPNVKVTDKLKFINGNAYVLVEAKSGQRKYYILVGFQKSVGIFDKIPLAYAPSSTVYGGKVCSYYWDGRELVGVTRPAFSIYLDSNFYWSPQIVVPRRPAGPNEKKVRFITNFNTEVHGYKTIDEVYTTGNLYLLDGAKLDLAYANGKVYTDRRSSAKETVEDGNLVYPKFKTDLDDNNITGYYRRGHNLICYPGQTLKVNEGKYGSLIIYNGCRVILQGSDFTFKKIVAYYGSSIEFEGNNVELKARSISLDWYASLKFNPKDPNKDYIVVKAQSVDLGIGASFECSYPPACLLDTNDITTNWGSKIIFTTLARRSAYIYYSKVIGNLFAENLTARGSTFCNVVDSDGHQILANAQTFYDITVANGNVPFTTPMQVVFRTVCTNANDCLAQIQ